MKKHPFIFTTGNVSTRLLSSCRFRPVRSEEQTLSLRYAVDWRERQKCISTHSSNVAKGLSILHKSNNCLSNICLEVEDESILVELRKDPTFCFSLCLTTRAHVAFHLHEMIRIIKHVKLTALKKKVQSLLGYIRGYMGSLDGERENQRSLLLENWAWADPNTRQHAAKHPATHTSHHLCSV